MGTGEDLRTATVQDLLDHMLARTVDGLGARAGALVLLDPGADVLAVDVSVGLPWEFMGLPGRVRVTDDPGDPVVEAIHLRQPVWTGSGESEEPGCGRLQHAALSPYPRGTAVAPLLTPSAVWGALLVLMPKNGPGPDEDARLRLTTAGRCIAWMLQGAAAAGHRLVPGPEPRFLPLPSTETVAPGEARAAADLVASLPEGGCRLDSRGRIIFVDPTAADLLGVSATQLLGTRPWEAVPWLDHAVHEHRHRIAVAEQLPTTFTAQRPLGGRLLFQIYPDRTGVSVRIGLVDDVFTPRSPGPPDTDASAGPVRPDALSHLMCLSGALAEAASVRQIVDLVADHLVLSLRAQAFALLVSEAGRVRIVGHRGFNPNVMDLVDHAPLVSDVAVPGMTAGAPSLELNQGVPAFFSNREEMRAVHPKTADIDDGMGAWAWLPLMVSGRAVGICVVGYERPHVFTLQERTTLTSLGALIAQALDRARQYDAAQELAEGLQARLLPRTLPRIQGLQMAARYLPASHGMDVGGDFYDLIRLSDTEAAAVIGDVQGHDVSAAGLMGQVRTAVHAYAVAGATPGEVLARTNRLLSDLDPDLLTSCLYAHIDIAGHCGHLATAGHVPPLLRPPGRPSDVLDLPPGPLLGVDPAAEYPTTQIDLCPGTLLAAYTDGLVETHGKDHDANIAELAAVLSDACGPLDGIADALLAQAQPSGDRTDDTALLLLSVEAQPTAGPET
ncbi:SpoIIE family protein phosphatase [Streptomyces sp. NPDC052036]|uniref:SpoIIE family protein phosphatase n=1 Tax=unclassified Streptomyces TaxID=2593676 RepID=UPI003436CC8D